jgi:hypothetical protein
LEDKNSPLEEIFSFIILISSPNQNFAPPYLITPKKPKTKTKTGKA